MIIPANGHARPRMMEIGKILTMFREKPLAVWNFLCFFAVRKRNHAPVREMIKTNVEPLKYLRL